MRVLVLATLLAFAASPALADWTWWTWGMAPDGLYAASRGAVVATEPGPGDIHNDGGTILYPRGYQDIVFNDIPLGVTMLFDADDRLVMVRAKLRDPEKCTALEAGLAERYGERTFPVAPSDTGRLVYWQDGENIVYLASVPIIGLCDLTFRPYRAGGRHPRL